MARQEQTCRVGDLNDAVVDQVEAADLVDGAESVLDGSEQSQSRAAIAFELEHDVDEVLQHSRAGHRSVLGDVTDEQGGDVVCLAFWMTAEATSRTWVTPPGTPSTSAEPMVCTESTIRSPGFTVWTWVRSPPRSVSAAR